MALKAKVRGRVRTVSPAMARRLRAKGFHVEDTSINPLDVLSEMLTGGGAPAAFGDLPPASNELRVAEPVVTVAAFDLTDEELERLTAPDVV